MPSDEVARDTIAAIATPAGRGGIGVVRVSGPEVPRIARAILGRLPEPRQATFAAFADVDEGIALYFPAPHSYTGEPVLELQGHGGPVVMQSLLAACLDTGARLAEPGEFTRRAFLEGKLDLAQAEAVADLIDATTREAARSALRSLAGEFSAAVTELVAQLTGLRALVEAMLDFPEEEIDPLHAQDAAARLARLREALDAVLAKSRQGSLLRTGVHVVLVGRPNVGKSSLLNRLAGDERAIVAPVPGTTRDALREPVQIEGVSLVLVDTAGLRRDADAIERLGMERTRRELESADVVLAVHEAGSKAGAPEDLPQRALRIDVYNKIDLAPEFPVPASAVGVSAKTGVGLDRLECDW
jgi:tRNA modification GTPase